MFLGLCCASDFELAAVVVEHSVAIRVISSSEDIQLASTQRALHRLLRICKAYDVVCGHLVFDPNHISSCDDVDCFAHAEGRVEKTSAFSGRLGLNSLTSS